MPFCMECGKKLPDGAVFCSECGTKQTITELRQTQPVISAAPAEPVAVVPAETLFPKENTESVEITAEQKAEPQNMDPEISDLPLTNAEAAHEVEPNGCVLSESSKETEIPSEVTSLSDSAEEVQIDNMPMSAVNTGAEAQAVKSIDMSFSDAAKNENNQEKVKNAAANDSKAENMPSQEYDFKEPISIFCQRDFSYVFEKEDIKKNRIISALCYFPPFFFILLLFKSKSRFCLFHANQGLLLTLTTLLWTLFNSIIGTIIRYNFVVVTSWGYSALSTAGYVLTAVIWGIQAIVTLTWFYLGLIDTMNGRAKKLPLIGRINLIFK